LLKIDPAEAEKGIPPAAAASVAGGGDQVFDLDPVDAAHPILFLRKYMSP